MRVYRQLRVLLGVLTVVSDNSCHRVYVAVVLDSLSLEPQAYESLVVVFV